MSSNKIIVILAGGEGKRMKSSIPKVLHKVHNIPMIVRIVNLAVNLSPVKIILVVGKNKDLINNVLEEYKINDQITYSVQKEPLGSGHAVKCSLDECKDLSENNRVLILNGDMPLLKLDILEDLYKLDKNMIIASNLQCPAGYGRLIFTEHGIKIKEEKDCSDDERKITLINAGIYMIKLKELRQYIPQLTCSNKQNEYYLTDIIALIPELFVYILPASRNNEILGVNTQDELTHVNTLI